MSMSPEVKAEVQEILRRVVRKKLPVRWKSNERLIGAGERRSTYRGNGDDYDGTAQYQPGDDTRDIDWRAYAQSDGQELLVNVYRQTTEITARIIVDVSDSMSFGTTRATKRRLAAELATSVIGSLDKTKDRVGSMLFSRNGLERINKPAIASLRPMFLAAASVLQTNQTTGNGNGLAKSLRRLPTSRTMVFIISDFLNMSKADWEALHRASRRHDIVCMYVQDIRERELPDVAWGWGPLHWLTGRMGCFYTLEDSTGDQRTIWVNRKTRALYATNFRKHEASVIARFKAAHCRWLVVSTEEGEGAFPKIGKTLGGGR